MGFKKDFLWGAASAAHQIEGAYDEDGKGLGIWDALNEGHIKHQENGNIACDHYHKYKEDVAIMKSLGLKTYRFSVSWPRIMPEEGVINKRGIQFYIDLVEELLEANIEPMCTLFHWNLPMWLHEKGGWKFGDIEIYFEEYTKLMVQALSDKVKYWITLNEPQCFVGLGYVMGIHAPFLKEPENVEQISRNVMRAHGKAVLAIRKYTKQEVMIGMAPTGSCMSPYMSGEEGIDKAREATYSVRAGVMGTDWWADPIILGEIPKELEAVLNAEDIEIINQPLDFYGYNIYNTTNYNEYGNMKNPFIYPGLPRTSMEWAITEDALYWSAKFHYERYGLPILITENGMANNDFVMLDGKVHDPQRIDYIHRYLKGLKKIVEEGVPVIGYQYWSIMDNFEWAEGYDKRFGLIYIDYQTNKRIIKDSAYFYAEVIKSNGENL